MESHSKLSCNSKNDENNIILLWIMYHFQRDGTWYNWVVEEFVKTLNLALVCSCVRLFATRFLRIRSLLFSETLQLVRTHKRGKSRFNHFGQKCPKFAILVQNAQKWSFSHFYRNNGFAILSKIRKWPFLAKTDPNLAISSLIRRFCNIFSSQI